MDKTSIDDSPAEMGILWQRNPGDDPQTKTRCKQQKNWTGMNLHLRETRNCWAQGFWRCDMYCTYYWNIIESPGLCAKSEDGYTEIKSLGIRLTQFFQSPAGPNGGLMVYTLCANVAVRIGGWHMGPKPVLLLVISGGKATWIWKTHGFLWKRLWVSPIFAILSCCIFTGSNCIWHASLPNFKRWIRTSGQKPVHGSLSTTKKKQLFTVSIWWNDWKGMASQDLMFLPVLDQESERSSTLDIFT